MNDIIERARDIITGYDGPKVRIMEVCGTHTHEIFRLGIRSLLPENIDLISGPGCPVCVTPVGFIDEAIYLATEKNCLITTFGDLIKVPGTEMNLAKARANGAKIRPVYSPDDAVEIARENPSEEVVFLSVGFETTTPSSCLAVKKAKDLGLKNFSILTANKSMPGHVNAITGNAFCRQLKDLGVSGVVAGFTATELMTALAVTIEMLKKGEPFFVNCYPRVVKDEGSIQAQKLMDEVMELCDTQWRGLGTIEKSGMKLKSEFSDFDSRIKYNIPHIEGKPNPGCRCGEVLQGHCKPSDCPLFGKICTPLHAVGACMVSDEGACSAYYQYNSSINN